MTKTQKHTPELLPVYGKGDASYGGFDQLQIGDRFYSAKEVARRMTLPVYAAAPDLLEAVKLLQAALTEYNLRDVKKRYSLCVADAAANAAIFKAEGGR